MSKQKNSLPPIILDDVQQICTNAAWALKRLEGKTILIAGAAGFLPSYFVHTLAYANLEMLKRPCKVICLDNFRTGKAERLLPWKGHKNIKFLTKDIIKPLNIKDDIDYIIHGASIASPVWYRKFPLETIDANVIGTRRLLDLARVQKSAGFLYLSSSEIYGDPLKQFIPTSEDYWGNVSSTGPRACYDQSKRLAETLCMTYYRQFDVPVKIIRPFNVYGPGLRLDDGRVVPDFIKNALEKKTITIFSNGKVTRSFCYVTDAISAMIMLLTNDKADGEAFNVGNDEEVTIFKLAKTVDEVVGNKEGVNFVENSDKAYLKDNPQRRVPNLGKIQKTIDWTPRIPLAEGLRRTICFYKGDKE